MKTYYFLSGLPRSGSSMLSALLNQNPTFYSGPSSPVCGSIVALESSIENNDLYKSYPKPAYKKSMLQSSLYNYYNDVKEDIIFDKNRSWTHRPEYISKYFDIKNPKIICTVRNLDEVLTSFIAMISRNQDKKLNFIDRFLQSNNLPLNDFTRCQYIASDGPLGRAYTGLKNALSGELKDNILLVEYSDLVENTDATMKSIYNFIEQPYYQHDYKNLYNKHREKDNKVYGLSDMHHVSSKIKYYCRKPADVLPPQVISDVRGLEFWRQ